MKSQFPVLLESDERSDLQLMATLSGCDKSILIREWIKVNKAWFDEYIKEHRPDPGRTIGLYWMAGPYNPAGIRRSDTAYDESLKVKYQTQIETIKLEKAGLEKLKSEATAETNKLEAAQADHCAKCLRQRYDLDDDHPLRGYYTEQFASATYGDTNPDERPEPKIKDYGSKGWWVSLNDWWNSFDDQQQMQLKLALWGMVVIAGIAAGLVFYVGRVAGKW